MFRLKQPEDLRLTLQVLDSDALSHDLMGQVLSLLYLFFTYTQVILDSHARTG